MTFIELLRRHIRTPFMTAFAYGSGVFKQETCSKVKVKKMIDYLVVVRSNELKAWHEENSRVNPSDYPILGRLAVSKSKLFDESVYYVPDVLVAEGGRERIKYGVLGWDTLLRDLFTWDTMFLAGRLQKPTIRSELAEDELEEVLRLAMDCNLEAALKTSILMNPKTNDFKQILRGIVSLSYTNDPRLLLAESPQKVENIVTGQLGELESMYGEKYQGIYKMFGGQFGDPLVRMELINSLPFALKTELNRTHSLWQVALNIENPRIVSEAVGRIVKRSAWRQMVLGAISTPPKKALVYAMAKVNKRFNKA